MAILRRSACLLALAAAADLCGAAEFEAAALVGAGASDNVDRVTDDARDASMASAGLRLSVLQESRKLSADVTADLAYLRFDNSSFDDQFVGNVMGSAIFYILPSGFSWQVEDAFGQTRQALGSALRPTSSEHLNQFTTGPNLAFELLPDTNLVATARYTRVDYTDSPLDSQRYAGTAGLEHRLAGAGRISANVSDERVETEEAAGVAGYDRQSAFLGYELEGMRTQAGINVGTRRIKRSGENISGLLLRAHMSRRVGRLSVISLDAGREYADAGSMLLADSGALPPANFDASSFSETADPFTHTYARLRWDSTGRRTAIGLFLGVSDEAYEETPLRDRQSVGLEASVARQVSPRLNARISLARTLDDLDDSIGDYNETLGKLGLIWNAGRRTFFDLALEVYRFKSAQDPQHVTERRLWLRFGYGATSVRGVGRPAR